VGNQDHRITSWESKEQILFYLDPHTTQPTVPFSKFSGIDSYFYQGTPKSVSFSAIDESLALIFFCRDLKDFVNLLSNLQEIHKRCEPIISLVQQSEKPNLGVSLNVSGDDFEMD